MHTFDDVLSQLVTLLRRADTGGFVPHPAKSASASRDRSEPPRRTTCAGPISYRDAYGCPASSWGEGGYVPEAKEEAGAAASAAPTCRSGEARPLHRPSVRMPFRVFDDT